MSKISSSILILRKATASAWTTDLDNRMNQWLTQYTNWLETNPLALGEKAATKLVSPLIFILVLIDPVPC